MSNKDGTLFAIIYLQATAAITAFLGIFLLLQPEVILGLFIPGATGDFFIRFIGSALIGYSTLNYLASRSKNFVTYKIALDANLAALAIATVLSIFGVLQGAIVSFQWLLIGEHIVFTAFFVWARKVLAR